MVPLNLQLRSRLPAGQCYCVVERHVRDQVSEVIRQFNVSVSVNNIFSRCQVSSVLGTGNKTEWSRVHLVHLVSAWWLLSFKASQPTCAVITHTLPSLVIIYQPESNFTIPWMVEYWFNEGCAAGVLGCFIHQNVLHKHNCLQWDWSCNLWSIARHVESSYESRWCQWAALLVVISVLSFHLACNNLCHLSPESLFQNKKSGNQVCLEKGH